MDIALAPREFALLEHLMRAAPAAVGKEAIVDSVWGQESADPNVVEVYVGYLRRKTEAEGERRLIHTVRGVGYVLRETPP